MRARNLILGLGLLLSLVGSAHAKTVRYELTATRGSVDLSGRGPVDFALMLNGKIPAPILEFTEGDEAEIVVRNNIPGEELSIHWHGILLPSEMDGVPYVTTPPIFSGDSFTFRFKIRQHGTYWYHSHTNVQEQKGLYGAFVIHPKKKKYSTNYDRVVVLSDWSDEDALTILKNLRKDGDYYLHKKNTMRSWIGAISEGALGTFLHNEWTRMGGMDYSDVGYDAFLINGKRESDLLEAKAGESIRLRIINAAASTYFHIALGNQNMKVISADGIDVAPIRAREILIGMAETYDLLFKLPDSKKYELKITAQDGTGTASTWIGSGKKEFAPIKPKPPLYESMDHSAHANHGQANHGQGEPDDSHANHGQAQHGQGEPDDSHAHHGQGKPDDSHANHGQAHHGQAHHGQGHHGQGEPDDSHANHGQAHHGQGHHGQGKPDEGESDVVSTLTVDNLKSPTKTSFAKNAKVHNVKFVLGGDMERYVWHLNGKAIHQDRTVEINEGDVVRFTFENQTMMHHPMHLHGHFFRVLGAQGERAPLKHTVDVAPHSTRTIEFLADEPGEWMLHCHNLYHLKTGMARVIKYSSFKPKKEMLHWQKHDPHLHDHWYFYGMLEAASNHGQAYFRGSQTWNQVELRVETANVAGKNFSFGERWDYEGDLFYRRWIDSNLNLIGGATSFGREVRAALGVGYRLPLLIESNLLVNHSGRIRLDLEKRFQWAKTIFSDVDFSWRPNQKGDHAAEFEVTLMYSPAWAWAVGAMITNDSIGGGIQVQF